LSQKAALSLKNTEFPHVLWQEILSMEIGGKQSKNGGSLTGQNKKGLKGRFSEAGPLAAS
jgi:hypothetical protein